VTTMSEIKTTAERGQAANIAAGGDGCCHKTRLKGDLCPVGWKCPHIKEEDVANAKAPNHGLG
jgi:hypothetical protein